MDKQKIIDWIDKNEYVEGEKQRAVVSTYDLLNFLDSCNQWISVETALPEDEGTYPVWFEEDDGERHSRTAYFTTLKGQPVWMHNANSDLFILYPKGWQPLPSAPEAE